MRYDANTYYCNTTKISLNAPMDRRYLLALIYSGGTTIGGCRVERSSNKWKLNAYIVYSALTANDHVRIYAR